MGTTAEEARAARDAKLDALHERLTGAVEALVSGDDWRRALEFAARFRARSFNNTLLIWSQHLAAFEQGRVPEAVPSYVAGYKQWQSLGRQVTRGQPGYMIFAPVKGRFATATPQDGGLSPLEHTAIDLALADAVRSSEVPILPMVVDRILAPNPADDEDGRLAEDGRMVGHALRRLVAGDLQGLFDGPSTVRFDPSLPMVSLDLSRVAENSTLISVLMTCSSAWMESALLDPAGGQRWVIYDEAWRLMQYPALLRRMDAQWRLARHYAPYYYWPIWPMIGTAVPALVLWVSGGSMANRSRPDDRDRRRLDRGR